ncbi:MAG: hypothetical protein IT327_06850 [Anaerolineae bacterium]|jgi:hypothetical protein|nr:hypothetical protein [Anaerolineae bacterium]
MKDEKRVEESVITPIGSTEAKKLWQKPRIQQLRISLDTAFGAGSGADGAFITPF